MPKADGKLVTMSKLKPSIGLVRNFKGTHEIYQNLFLSAILCSSLNSLKSKEVLILNYKKPTTIKKIDKNYLLKYHILRSGYNILEC